MIGLFLLLLDVAGVWLIVICNHLRQSSFVLQNMQMTEWQMTEFEYIVLFNQAKPFPLFKIFCIILC